MPQQQQASSETRRGAITGYYYYYRVEALPDISTWERTAYAILNYDWLMRMYVLCTNRDIASPQAPDMSLLF